MSRKSRTLFAAFAAAFLLATGCASKPHLAVEHFTINAPGGPLPERAPGARPISLAPVRVNPLYLDPSLVYHVGGDRVEVDSYASLAASPRSLLNEAIRASLLQPAVRNLVSGLVGPAGLTVEIFVEEISGDFRRPEEPAAVLSLEVSVYVGDPSPGTLPVLRKVYARREPLPKRTASSVVAAWNRSLPSIMSELGADLAAIPVAEPARKGKR